MNIQATGAGLSRFSTCIFGYWRYQITFSEAGSLSWAPSSYTKATNFQSPALDKEQLQPFLLRRVTQVISLLPWGAQKTRLHSSRGSVPKEGPQRWSGSWACSIAPVWTGVSDKGCLIPGNQPLPDQHLGEENAIHTDLRAFEEWLIHFLKYLRNIKFPLTIIILAWEGLYAPS